MASEEEHACLCSLQGSGKVADLPVEGCLVKVKGGQDLETELFQRGGYIARVVLRVGQLGCVLVSRVTDDQSDTLLSLCTRGQQHQYQQSNGGAQHGRDLGEKATCIATLSSDLQRGCPSISERMDARDGHHFIAACASAPASIKVTSSLTIPVSMATASTWLPVSKALHLPQGV